jgi:hypothetical protein
MLNSKDTLFAEDLAEKLARRFPPKSDQQRETRPSVNRVTRLLEETCADAKAYQSERPLGWWRRVRFVHAFRWRLDALGYSQEFVGLATEVLVVSLSKQPENKR